MTARTLASRVAESMLSKKASDVIIIDLRKVSTVADYFVLCTGDSDVQVRAIADAIEDDTDNEGQSPWHTEGRGVGIWVVLDFVDVVAHVFHKEARSFYNLERLWSDAKIKRVRDTAAGPERKATKRPTRKVTTRAKNVA